MTSSVSPPSFNVEVPRGLSSYVGALQTSTLKEERKRKSFFILSARSFSGNSTSYFFLSIFFEILTEGVDVITFDNLEFSLKNFNQTFSIYRLSSIDYNNLINITFFSDEDNRFDAMVIFRNSKYLNIKNYIMYLYYSNNLQSSILRHRENLMVFIKSCTYSQWKISPHKFIIKNEKFKKSTSPGGKKWRAFVLS